MTALENEMENYRRVLENLVRQVEEKEDARREVVRGRPRTSSLCLDDKIERLGNHIRALSRATKDNPEAHSKLLNFMQRTTTVVEYDAAGGEKMPRKSGRFFMSFHEAPVADSIDRSRHQSRQQTNQRQAL